MADNTQAADAALPHKGFRYWFRVLLLAAVAATYGGQWLGQRDFWVPVRYRVYQFLQGLASRQSYPQRTILILIGDEEYWRGELAGRIPIKRDYLAKLVRALDSCDPAVIALDFDLRSPMPDGSVIEDPDYQNETSRLIEAVKDVSLRRQIVLPKTIARSGGNQYVLESDIYDRAAFPNGRVRVGYIALPSDLRRVALHQPLKGGGNVESFAEAIAHSFDERALQPLSKSDTLPFGGYLSANSFLQYSANEILENKSGCAQDKISHKIVIVSGGWRSFAYGRGRRIDTYLTPIGNVGGVFIHANYVEALLDLRVFKSWAEKLLTGLDVALVIAVAIVFAFVQSRRRKVLYLGFFCVFLLVGAYVSLQNLGIFFDFLVPLFLVFLHSLYEQVLEWKQKAKSYSGPQEAT